MVRHPSGAGRRVETYSHLLGGAPAGDAPVSPEAVTVIELEEEQLWRSGMEGKIRELQSQVEELTALVHHLRAELGAE